MSKSSFFPLTPLEKQRYARHLVLSEVGIDGQQKLKNAKVLCVGTGGLGSSVLLYLAAAGVGTLGFVDDDDICLSNLQRQILFSTSNIGEKKVIIAHKKLHALNPEIILHPTETRLTRSNALSVLEPYDIVVDCTDNFYTRYVINDACVFLEKPNVFASIAQFNGQCSVFCTKQGPCYRCLFPSLPAQQMIPNCSEAGVMGMLPGVLGSIQAMEVIKLILSQGTPLVGKLLLVDSLRMQFNQLNIPKQPHCLCSAQRKSYSASDYVAKTCQAQNLCRDISVKDLHSLIKKKAPIVLIDVRELHEHEICHIGGQLIPLDTLELRINEFDPNQEIIIYCKIGTRSQKAALTFKKNGFKNVRVLRGGISQWIDEVDCSLRRY